MDETTYHQPDERPVVSNVTPGDPSAEPLAATSETPDEGLIVSICAWCPQLNILKMQRREGDVVIITQQAKELRIWRNGVVLTVSHGICPTCKERMRREP